MSDLFSILPSFTRLLVFISYLCHCVDMLNYKKSKQKTVQLNPAKSVSTPEISFTQDLQSFPANNLIL